ncbi:unnamed protein product [Arabis nemorensis]|uniref:Uncharacterized protein n=1 Tax=Arabis nemorensis TaxID=586526 RepID=A0A565B4Y8_9BRAS|nr:unnamed protein product [Arabis nemorensis]
MVGQGLLPESWRQLELSENYMEKKKKNLLINSVGLPHPPPKVKEPGENFAVKLIKFDKNQQDFVLKEIAWIKSTDEVSQRKKLKEIIAKLEAVSGVAVMGPME